MHPSNRGRQWIFGCLASLSRNRRGDFVSQGYCRGSLGLARTPERRRRGHTCHITSDRRRADMNAGQRSEEHTSELQSLMRISYAVFCLKKKNKKITNNQRRSLLNK